MTETTEEEPCVTILSCGCGGYGPALCSGAPSADNPIRFKCCRCKGQWSVDNMEQLKGWAKALDYLEATGRVPQTTGLYEEAT